VIETTTHLINGSSPRSLILTISFDNKQLLDLESGNMVFMMSKSAYLYDEGITTDHI
jgi:hypothetical protein